MLFCPSSICSWSMFDLENYFVLAGKTFKMPTEAQDQHMAASQKGRGPPYTDDEFVQITNSWLHVSEIQSRAQDRRKEHCINAYLSILRPTERKMLLFDLGEVSKLSGLISLMILWNLLVHMRRWAISTSPGAMKTTQCHEHLQFTRTSILSWSRINTYSVGTFYGHSNTPGECPSEGVWIYGEMNFGHARKLI